MVLDSDNDERRSDDVQVTMAMSDWLEFLEAYRSMGWVGHEMMAHLVECSEEDTAPDPNKLTAQGVEYIVGFFNEYMLGIDPETARSFLAWVERHFDDECNLVTN